MVVTHEIRNSTTGFSHRLVSPTVAVGQWVGYRFPACLKTKAGTFVAVTDYWLGVEPFPAPGRIYLVKEKQA